MIDINELKFDEKGLIPAIVVDSVTKRVLTLAYMNEESLRISMEKELTCLSITADCDRDELVVMVEPDGPACHLGTESCFEYPVWESSTLKDFSYEGLMDLIDGRRTEPKEGSYTSYLFEKGLDKILKKVGEETTEVIVAAKSAEQSGDNAETVYEIADLAYHVMVLMDEAGITLEDIHRELASRHVIDKKVKQEKMV